MSRDQRPADWTPGQHKVADWIDARPFVSGMVFGALVVAVAWRLWAVYA